MNLRNVEKPARYVGGEYNTPVIKTDAKIRFLICFPDAYEVAMSNLGIKLIYHMLNERPDTACERCFTPWVDADEIFSLETKTPPAEFDIIGFSLQYELSYTNILRTLKLAGIPLYAAERGNEYPPIIAGGPCAVNPAPLDKIIDAFLIGDGEVNLPEFLDAFTPDKDGFLRRASKLKHVYVPKYNAGAKRAVVKDLDAAYFPTKIQVPNIETVHDRASLEIFRGCTRGCRFCQAGFIYRPQRLRSVETLARYFKETAESTGFDEVSLSSLSTCDYPDLRRLLAEIKPFADARRVNISLPSLRADSFEADATDSARKSSLTFAPEAGTQRLRDVINKNITEEDILNSLRVAFGKGYSSVKLYFMLGLPTETDADVSGIVDLVYKIKKTYKEAGGRKPPRINVSTSVFVPKPFTPFEREAQLSVPDVAARQSFLRAKLKVAGVNYSWHDPYASRLEAAFARGGSELNAVLVSAFRAGCVFDGWTEFFDNEKWEKAFSENGLNIDAYAAAVGPGAKTPWGVIDAGVSERFLQKELRLAYRAKTTPACTERCGGCGMQRTCEIAAGRKKESV